jgi:hypothetical protein
MQRRFWIQTISALVFGASAAEAQSRSQPPRAPADGQLTRDPLADRLAIRETIERYFVGLDRRDGEWIAAAFTEDAEGEINAFGSKSVFKGRAAFGNFAKGMAQFASSNHALSNVRIVVNGDRASSDTFAIAHLLANDKIMVRGLQYVDDLVRESDGWRIARRTHRTLWQYDVPSTPIR